jgi:hypothetical protein
LRVAWSRVRLPFAPGRLIVRTTLLTLSLAIAFVVASGTPLRVTASDNDTVCETFRHWFSGQPGWQLVLSATGEFDRQFARPRKPDTILDYSPVPFSNYRTSWYSSMKHYNIVAGNGHCSSGFYDPAHKTALILSEYGTRSDLTLTNVSSAFAGLPSRLAPSQTRNGVQLGMTVAQVQAIDGPGTLRSNGHYQRLLYSQDLKKAANTKITFYIGFLFVDGKLVAVNAGGGI